MSTHPLLCRSSLSFSDHVGPICGLHRPLAQEEEEETQEEQETQEEEEEEEKEEKANAAAPPPPLLSFNRSFSPPPLLSFAAPLNESFVFSQHSRIQHNGRLEGGEAGGLGVAQLETSSSWVCHMRRRIHTSEALETETSSARLCKECRSSLSVSDHVSVGLLCSLTCLF